MIIKESNDWKVLLKQLQRSKLKSNRDILCAKCWRIYSYEGNIKHKLDMPEHMSNIITSKGYGNEAKFMAIATALNKVHV